MAEVRRVGAGVLPAVHLFFGGGAGARVPLHGHYRSKVIQILALVVGWAPHDMHGVVPHITGRMLNFFEC